MTELIIPAEAPDLNQLKERRIDILARRAIFALLKRLVRGQITLVEDRQRYRFGEESDRSSLQAVITVHHPQLYSRIFFGGSIGAAEAYMEGFWSADDLTTVMRILALNQKAFEDMEKGLARLTAPLYKFYHFVRKNTKTGSRKNILAHYDLGNDFYALFLDRNHDLFLRHIRTAGQHPQASIRSQIRSHLPQAAACPRRPDRGNRHRLGRLCRACGPSLSGCM